jgi:ketosteroid isomerase-like protein
MPEPSANPDPVETFQDFVAAINAHDSQALASLMPNDHLFIDSLGNRVQGAARMQAGWSAYFTMCPDYWIQIDHLLSENGVVLATGHAGGTIDGFPWRITAAWRAVVGQGRMLEWQVFADNKPVYEVLARRKS